MMMDAGGQAGRRTCVVFGVTVIVIAIVVVLNLFPLLPSSQLVLVAFMAFSLL